jgi:hypothetical protein
MRVALLGLAFVLTACGDVRVLANGDQGELWAEVKVANGVQLLGPLPAGAPSVLMISRWEQTTDGDGRRSERIAWTSTMPDVRFEPAGVASVSDLALSEQGTFLTLTVTPAASGVGTLYVRGEPLGDSWDLSFE